MPRPCPSSVIGRSLKWRRPSGEPAVGRAAAWEAAARDSLLQERVETGAIPACQVMGLRGASDEG
jgi:hypothetical protein